VSGLFLIGYGAFRFIVEFAREPDDFLGLLALGLSMGQWLSLPMIVAGIALDLGSGWVGPFLVAGVVGIATALPLALAFRERPLIRLDGA